MQRDVHKFCRFNVDYTRSLCRTIRLRQTKCPASQYANHSLRNSGTAMSKCTLPLECAVCRIGPLPPTAGPCVKYGSARTTSVRRTRSMLCDVIETIIATSYAISRRIEITCIASRTSIYPRNVRHKYLHTDHAS